MVFIPLPVHESSAASPGAERDVSREAPHFRAIGYESGASALAQRFYHYMDTLPRARKIRQMHPTDLTHPREVLTRYLIEWTGGPPVYSRERGHPRLRQRHAAFSIGPEERDAWMECMDRALADIVPEVNAREELHRAFAKVAAMLATR